MNQRSTKQDQSRSKELRDGIASNDYRPFSSDNGVGWRELRLSSVDDESKEECKGEDRRLGP